MREWTCPCTAINEALLRKCWRCSLPRPESEQAITLNENAKAETSLRELLLPYLGQVVLINADDAQTLTEAYLVAINSESFAVKSPSSTYPRHFQFRYLLSLILPDADSQQNGDLLQIEVYRQVFVRGSAGVGLTIPI
jgi:hypothetical protein